ncbi:MAG: biopolymer transporter ExbD [Desulfuromonas sp.]|nr:biopolymer transporter ExbD [Desulfuromonas sp.]
MAFQRKKREDIRVELTPMIDVVFLLLIFFMISTTFVESSGIDINLPTATNQKIDKQPHEVKVYLEKSGLIHLNDRLVSLDDLQTHLASYGRRASSTTFVLLADEQAKHGRVVNLMDIAQRAGFAKLAIATEPKPLTN